MSVRLLGMYALEPLISTVAPRNLTLTCDLDPTFDFDPDVTVTSKHNF